MNQYQLKGTSVIVELVELNTWDVIAKRIDNQKVDTYPIQYFKKFFREVTKSEVN